MQIEKVNLKARVSFGGPDWAAIKQWVENERNILISKLIGAKTHDESQRHRGAIDLLDKLLAAEKDAG